MSEEILKALTQLFAIFSKQDYGTSQNEREFIIRFFKEELDQDSVEEYLQLYDKLSGFGSENQQKKKRTSVSDSVRTLGICRKINKTLTQQQKVVVLVKIMELVTSDNVITETETEILNTVADVFNFSKEEYKLIEDFIFFGVKEIPDFNSSDILVATEKNPFENSRSKFQYAGINGSLYFLRVPSVGMYLLRYIGDDELILNGFVLKKNRGYLFSNGSTVKMPSGEVIYFSDLIAHFNDAVKGNELSFEALNLEFKFPNGTIGLRDINISEGSGKLIGIMGASGAGKTTLMNVLAGLEIPSNGSVTINGIDIHKDKTQIQGTIGYIAQDDLLNEDLTVYQNLYYNAKLCFGDQTEEEIHKRVMDVLENLGLDHQKDLKVGSILNKKISGGQRKRLNIALELIREPAVLFVDEPTSGLSSRDSENVIDLLKELCLKGKLIFVVIHQPSSDIYKMFDKMFILDTGGYPVYYGHPVEAVVHFKEASHQVDSHKGLCVSCGNVNPEQVFNILDAKVVDEFGQLTSKRKINSKQWYDHFTDKFSIKRVKRVTIKPPNLLKLPNRFKQTVIFTTRDLLSKISNKQYLMLNLGTAPLLAFILSWITKYTDHNLGEYVFRYNDNIPVFFLMSIVVALFLGLIVSAEEILRDRKILKRESFLNLSWNSYLVSKVFILFSFSALQSLLFVLIGVWLLEIEGMIFAFWLIMFSVSCFANLTGLIVSSAFNSAVTVYILIPIILIPQMILSGLMFPFDKLNKTLNSEVRVPIVADLMTSRWAFEALAIHQYKDNPFEAPFYELNKEIADSDYKTAYWLEELDKKTAYVKKNIEQVRNDSIRTRVEYEWQLIWDELAAENKKIPSKGIDFNQPVKINDITESTITSLYTYMNQIREVYQDQYNTSMSKKEKLVDFLESREGSDYTLNSYKDRHFNQRLSEIVRKIGTEDRLLEREGLIWKGYDPIYNSDFKTNGPVNFRAHFYAPSKPFMGKQFDTFWFNLVIIWLIIIISYITLYYQWVPKALAYTEKINYKIKNNKNN